MEISGEYIKFAENRLKNYENELKLDKEEISKHIVMKTFKERKEKGEFTGRYGPKDLNDKRKELSLFDYVVNDKN